MRRTRSRLSRSTGCSHASRQASASSTIPACSRPFIRQLHDSQKQLLQTAYLETLQDDARVRNYLAEEILKKGAQ